MSAARDAVATNRADGSSDDRRGRRRRSRGSTLVETAVVFPIFLILLLGVLDVAWIFFTKLALENGVREAGRLAATGQVIAGASGQGVTPTRLDSILLNVKKKSGLNVQTTSVTFSSVSSTGVTSTGPGGPGDVVTMRVLYTLPLLTPVLSKAFPGAKYTVDVSTSFKNEEF